MDLPTSDPQSKTMIQAMAPTNHPLPFSHNPLLELVL